MTHSLLTLRPLGMPPENGPWAWVMETGGRLRSGISPAHELFRPTDGMRTRLLLPGGTVTHASVEIASKNPRLIAQALPFALEEHVAEDIEQLRIAHGPRAADGRLEARIVRHSALDGALAALKQAGIEPDAAYSELDALPRPVQGWTSLTLPDLVLARNADGQALALEPELMGALTGSADCHELSAPEGPWVWLHRNVREAETIDLLGRQRRAGVLTEKLRPWRIPAAIASAALLLQAGLMAAETMHLNRERAAMQADIERLAREAAPDVRRWINPLAQLRQMAKGGPDATRGEGMLALLGAAAPALGNRDSVTPGVLRYHNRTLELDLDARDSTAFERLLESLRKQPGLQAELADQRVDGGQATAKLRIREVKG
ncbi:MAG: type II secretion system protein GspL [Pseudomonadota bacterium]